MRGNMAGHETCVCGPHVLEGQGTDAQIFTDLQGAHADATFSWLAL